MNQPDYNPLDHKTDNSLNVTQVGERTIFKVRRHPIGLFGAYALSGALTIAVAIIAFVAVPTDDSNSKAAAFAAIVFVVVALLCAGFTFFVTKIYTGNSWILTTDSLTQVTQNSLFDRQSSQLSLHNLEDITAQQNGILPHLFNFGTLVAETAGEASKFHFYFCPNPNYYARQILAAREAFLTEHGALSPPHAANFSVDGTPAVSVSHSADALAQHAAQANFLDPDTVAPPPDYRPTQKF